MLVTGFYAGLAALALVPLILNVALRRMKFKVKLGDGGNSELNRYMRTHGNFVETVPMALIVMALLEISGSALWVIHLLGLLLLAGRSLHYLGMNTPPGFGAFRAWGMILTLSVYVIGGLLLILRFFGLTFFMV